MASSRRRIVHLRGTACFNLLSRNVRSSLTLLPLARKMKAYSSDHNTGQSGPFSPTLCASPCAFLRAYARETSRCIGRSKSHAGCGESSSIGPARSARRLPLIPRKLEPRPPRGSSDTWRLWSWATTRSSIATWRRLAVERRCRRSTGARQETGLNDTSRVPDSREVRSGAGQQGTKFTVSRTQIFLRDIFARFLVGSRFQ